MVESLCDSHPTGRVFTCFGDRRPARSDSALRWTLEAADAHMCPEETGVQGVGDVFSGMSRVLVTCRRCSPSARPRAGGIGGVGIGLHGGVGGVGGRG